MKRRRQFSLAYLFVETFWVAAALAFFTQAVRVPQLHDYYEDVLQVALVLCGLVCMGAAIGGLFHRMTVGFLVGLILVLWTAIVLGIAAAGLDWYFNGWVALSGRPTVRSGDAASITHEPQAISWQDVGPSETVPPKTCTSSPSHATDDCYESDGSLVDPLLPLITPLPAVCSSPKSWPLAWLKGVEQ